MDTESLPPASPETSTLSKVLKRHKKTINADDLTTPSITSSDSLSVERRGSVFRASLDRGIEKLKRKDSTLPGEESLERRDSNDSNTGNVSRLSKILSSPSRRLRKQKQEDAKDIPDASADGLGLRHAYNVGADGTDANNHSSGNLSINSHSPHTRSVASSLFTEDSDPEQATKPSLKSRPSHAGYLTLSSPLIEAETVETPAPPPIVITEHDTTTTAGGPDVPVPNTLATTSNDTPAPKLGNEPASQPSSPTKEKDPTASDSPIPFGSFFGLTKDTVSPAKQKPGQLELKASTNISDSTVPSTVVTPATPEFSQPPSPKLRSSPKSLPPITHRRVRSAAAPSKLSLSSAPPLTPAIEEVKTPGGTLSASSSAGFFSSVFNVTQTASNQFSSFFTLPTSSGTRNRSGTGPGQLEQTGSTSGEEVILPASSTFSNPELSSTLREPAIATLGKGNLSLSHLGIVEGSPDASMTSDENGDDVVNTPTIIQDTATSNKSEEASAADAISTAYTAKAAAVVEKSASNLSDYQTTIGRPRSIGSGRGTLTSGPTPPQSVINGNPGFGTRSGSVRSKLSGTRKRHRNSSAATGSAIAAAITASGAALANPATINRKLTGFAVANQKRNKDFHTYFKSVPDDDYLIEDYSAALQREILLHGRLYISERNVCFSSNIMGYVTTLVINFDEIVAMEKRNTAMIFPNAIMIQTLHAKNVFASFLQRESTYELLLGIWRLKHPNIKQTESGHMLDNTAPVKNEYLESDDDEQDSEEDSGEEDDDDNSYMDMRSISNAGSDMVEPSRAGTLRQTSVVNPPGTNGNGTSKSLTPLEGASTGSLQLDFPGPATHAETSCSDSDTHYEKPVLDEVVPAPLGNIYSLMFGPASGAFMKRFLEDQDSGDIQYEDDKKGLGESQKTFQYSYIKKLTAALGPKQTKCIVSMTLDAFDLEKAVSVTCSTQTPDVPSGNVFLTKTRYCLMWGPGNSTRILMSSGVEWSGKSWVRGPIEKGAEQGQAQHGKDLAAALRSQIAARSPTKKGRSKGRKKKYLESPESGSSARQVVRNAPSSGKSSDWGSLEPIHAIFEVLSDILGPIFNTTTVLSILLGVVTLLWLSQWYRTPPTSSREINRFDDLHPQSLTAYEEMWRTEENDLWDWLENRLALDDIHGLKKDKKILKEASSKAKREELDAKMDQRQIDDAIRVTEEKLAALKASHERKRRREEL